MRNEVHATIFSVLFLIIFGLMNFYVFEHISIIIDWHQGMLYHFLLVLSMFAYFPAVMIEALFGKWWSKALYIIIAVCMGMVLVYSAVFLIVDVLKLFNVADLWSNGRNILLIGAIIGVLGIINASIIRVNNIKLYCNIKKNYRIVQVSDIHLGPIRGYKFLERIIYRVNKLNPDVVLITGDLVDWRYKYQKQGFRILKSIKAPTYFSMGNHEIYTGIGFVESLLEGTNVKVLRNTYASFQELQIIGIDDAEDKKHMVRQLNKIKFEQGKYRILMYHRPDSYKQAKGIDLMLSGHTHAGQMFPFNYVAWFMSHPLKGLHHYHGTTLYVNQGVGTWGPPMRIGCRSEVACIDLLKKHE